MFRVYKVKPKVADKIKAVQVTPEKAAEIANTLSGRVVMPHPDINHNPLGVPMGVDFPTLDGVKHCPLNDWIVRHEDSSFEIVENATFTENWEVARNTNAS